jgi:hypothetical protein
MLLQRFGYHMMPTSIVLTFDQALEQATAEDTHNYRITGPRGRAIRVKSAVYDPETETVTLRPSERISIHHIYKLTVQGTKAGGVADTQGLLLDGADAGNPGSNYRATLTGRKLVIEPASIRKSVRRWARRGPWVRRRSSDRLWLSSRALLGLQFDRQGRRPFPRLLDTPNGEITIQMRSSFNREPGASLVATRPDESLPE